MRPRRLLVAAPDPCAILEAPMLERFTEAGRRVMVLANDEARRFGHDTIASDHLLLGVARLPEDVTDPDSRRTADALSALDVTLTALREQVGPRHAQPRGEPGLLPLSDDAKRALEETLLAALASKKRVIEPSDFLLGLVAKPELGSAQVLDALGVSPQAVRAELARSTDR